MFRVQYRNFGNHESIVLNHTVDAHYPTGTPKAGIRWYELRKSAGSNPWLVYQQSTFSPNEDGQFMGAININASGQIALAYNSSGPGKFASLYFTGRNANDERNKMTYQENLVQRGDGYGTQNNRWGDYSDLAIDPTNDSLFWFAGMYGSTNWHTRISSFKLQERATIPDQRMMVSTIQSPAILECSTTVAPAVLLSNTGAKLVDRFMVYAQLNSGKIDTLSVTGPVLPGADTLLSSGFSTLNLRPGVRNLFRVWTNEDTASRTFQLLARVTNELKEGFEFHPFPPLNWGSSISKGSINWERSSWSAASGTYSALLRHPPNIVRKGKHLLVSPALIWTDYDSVLLDLDLAYPLDPTATDTFEIKAVDPCSNKEITLFKKIGPDLGTTLQPIAPYLNGDTTGFVPTSSQWKQLRLNITEAAKSLGEFQLEFWHSTDQGHNLYLDNIRLYPVNLPIRLKQQGYLVFPNPSNGRITIRHLESPLTLRFVQLNDLQGKRRMYQSYQGNALRSIELNLNGVAPGMYQLKLGYTGHTITERIIISR
jgi:hypothetical protein